MKTLKVETIDDGNKKKTKPPMTTTEILRSPGVLITLAIYSYSGLLGFAYTASMFSLTPSSSTR
jgi:hypothetical protein